MEFYKIVLPDPTFDAQNPFSSKFQLFFVYPILTRTQSINYYHSHQFLNVGGIIINPKELEHL